MEKHRLSTVKECDRIILLGEGHILEQGTYDELMDMKGGFYELMRTQSAQEKGDGAASPSADAEVPE